MTSVATFTGISSQSGLQSMAGTGLDPQVLNQVVEFAPPFWAKLHRVGRVSELSRDTRDRIHQLLGAFPGMWAMLLQQGEHKFENADQRRELYRQSLEASNARHTLPRDMCTFLGILASRWEAISQEDQNLELNEILSDGFWGLMGTGVLSQVPGTFRSPKVLPRSLERYCGALQSFWTEAARFTQSSKECPGALALIEEIMGLAIFEGVRLNEKSRRGESVGRLMLWYQGQDVTEQRGFYAGVARGLHEIGIVREALQRKLTLAPVKERWSYRRARKLIEKHTKAIVLTGILAMVPA